VDLDHYQRESRLTAIYPNLGQNLDYPVLGLCGEAGEVAQSFMEGVRELLPLGAAVLNLSATAGLLANQTKKIQRDDLGVVTGERRKQLRKELGGVLWYVAAICSELGESLSDVARENLEVLASRQARDVLRGDGDER